MKITTLQQIVKSGNKSYPIYIGFIKASDILKIAIVPNFDKNDTDESLANNLINTPVKKWQRPLIEAKRESITSSFNNSGEFMPNPVLLSENPHLGKKGINIVPLIVNGQTTNMWEVTISDANALWIIDGQHRIKGLGHPDCKQNSNQIPVVLLLNGNTSSYSPTDFAKIFAQVTTKATPLQPLHKEWLEYSFEMDNYESSTRTDAMETVIRLCSNPNFLDKGTKYPNPFNNKIVFNDENKQDNFLLNCQVLSDLIYNNYYKESASFLHFKADILAEVISTAYYQLKMTIPNPENSVFFSESSSKRHIIMTKSFLKGILAYLLKFVNPMDISTIPDLLSWESILKKLNFHKTDWDWEINASPGKEWYKKSEALASVVMIEAFKSQEVPDGCEDLQSCIVHGNNFFIEFEFTNTRGTWKLRVNNNRTIQKTGEIENIKIIDKSFNAEHLSIVDKATSKNYPVVFNIDYARKNKGKGVSVPLIKPPTIKRPHAYDSTNKFILEIKRTKYGGATDSIDIQFVI